MRDERGIEMAAGGDVSGCGVAEGSVGMGGLMRGCRGALAAVSADATPDGMAQGAQMRDGRDDALAPDIAGDGAASFTGNRNAAPSAQTAPARDGAVQGGRMRGGRGDALVSDMRGDGGAASLIGKRMAAPLAQIPPARDGAKPLDKESRQRPDIHAACRAAGSIREGSRSASEVSRPKATPSPHTMIRAAAMASVVLLAACQPGGMGGMIGGQMPDAEAAADLGVGPAAASPAQPQVVDPFAGQGVAPPSVPAAAGGQRGPVTAEGVDLARLPEPTAGAATPPPAPAAGATTAPAPRPGATAAPAAARSHTVAAGETAWSIARRHDVSVQSLAQANNLDTSMTVRVGQTLTIPASGGAAAQAGVTAPGQGSPTPEPPSAATPLPDERTSPAAAPAPRPNAPNLGATRTAQSGSGRFRMPVAGAITRTYSRGTHDGIAISAPTGTNVVAAGAGEVAAITQDTNGTQIVVLRHSDGLLTVYAGLGRVSVAQGAQVTAGQTIGTSGATGSLHFEVRRGYDSVNPEDYLG